LIELENVSKRYADRVALRPLSLRLARARTTALIGPSGCGKSTLLRIIVGLVRSDSGRVIIGGRCLTDDNVDALRHEMGYVIQDGGLFPHLTCEQNVTLLARELGVEATARRQRARELGELVRLPLDVLGRYPQQLSGGQRQRVSLMRALMLDPPVLLLDEPLGALDPVTRFDLQDQLKSIFELLGKTVVIVTHDLAEAAHLAHEILVMNDGGVIQRGAFDELLENPADSTVTTFVRAQRMWPRAPRP
jgi:osmoprotectant transport system ATP-binding protein